MTAKLNDMALLHYKYH